jgi:hypothetical protein
VLSYRSEEQLVVNVVEQALDIELVVSVKL